MLAHADGLRVKHHPEIPEERLITLLTRVRLDPNWSLKTRKTISPSNDFGLEADNKSECRPLSLRFSSHPCPIRRKHRPPPRKTTAEWTLRNEEKSLFHYKTRKHKKRSIFASNQKTRRYLVHFIYWLIDWLTTKNMIDWLIDWLIVQWLKIWFIDWLIDWLIDWFYDYAEHCQSIDWLIDRSITNVWACSSYAMPSFPPKEKKQIHFYKMKCAKKISLKKMGMKRWKNNSYQYPSKWLNCRIRPKRAAAV